MHPEEILRPADRNCVVTAIGYSIVEAGIIEQGLDIEGVRNGAAVAVRAGGLRCMVIAGRHEFLLIV
jgi:hypothetical protein